jgi:hypothetical protein
MKNKIAIASAFIAASSFSFAEIALTESFSVEGFIDTSYTDNSGASVVNGDDNNASLNVNEVEISFLFDMGGVSARVDTQYTNAGTEIDQAYVSYDAFGGTLSVGGMDSQLGYEAFEAPGLYANTFAFRDSQLPGTDVAVKFTMDLDAASSLGVALVDDGSFIGDEGASDTVMEIAYGRDLGNGLGAFVGYRTGTTAAGADDDVLNAYVTYETGALTFAAEIADGETDTDLMFLANYAYADNASVTVRLTQEENGAGAGEDLDILTIAHQLALADNLSLTTELTDNGAADDEYEFSVGALFTF